MPENPSQEASKDKSQKRRDFVRKLAEKVRQDDQDRQSWKDKQVVSSNARLGIKRRTNRPYPGATEVALPITDKFITKLKSMFVSVATLSKKQIVVNLDEGEDVTPETKASANRIERALNNLIRKRDFGWAKKVTLFVDYFLENGHSLFKIIEKLHARTINRTIDMNAYSPEEQKIIKSLKKDELIQLIAQKEELDLNDSYDLKQAEKIAEQIKSGKKQIKYLKKESYSEPTVIPERGLRIIVPYSATETQRLPRITHDLWMTYQELKDRAEKGIYDEEVVDSLKEDGGSIDDSLTNNSWALSEGVANREASTSGLYNVRECQTWYEGKKWVFTWIETVGNKTKDLNNAEGADNDIKILQEEEFPYEHGLWTYVKHDYELKNTRWYASRGIPEKIRGLHQTIEKMYNARLTRDEYNNAPMWRVSKQLGMSGDEIRMRPGQVIEAESGEIEQINKGVSVDISTERLEQQAKAYAEEYLSITDFSIANATNGNKERTATEINAIQQASTRQINTDIALFLDTLSEVSSHLYLITKQIVTVPTKIGGVLLTPDDFLVKVNVSWSGSLDATDPNFQIQKSMQTLNTVFQFGSPLGIVTPTNVYNMLSDMLDKDPDIENPGRYITTPEDIQLSELEEQQSEIIRMLNGFDVPVSPNDNDGVHLAVMEEYANSPQGSQALNSNPGILALFEKHMQLHIQSEAMKNGLKTQNAQGSQGNLGDPRSSKVRKIAS